MHSHGHVHLIRRRSTTVTQPVARPRCRLCAKLRRQVTKRGDDIQPLRKTADDDDDGLVRSLWCSECTRRLATIRRLKLAWLRRNRCPLKSTRRQPGRSLARTAAVADTAGNHTESSEVCQSYD